LAPLYPSAVSLSDGRVLVSGGLGTAKAARIYDPVQNTWTNTGAMHVARYQHPSTLLADGRVLVAGGAGANGDSTSAEIYDPSAGTWSLVASMNNARVSGHTATRLAD